MPRRNSKLVRLNMDTEKEILTYIKWYEKHWGVKLSRDQAIRKRFNEKKGREVFE